MIPTLAAIAPGGLMPQSIADSAGRQAVPAFPVHCAPHSP